MKYYEIEANKQGSRIIERFLDNGKRYIKHVPFNPKMVVILKEQFKDKPIEVELGNNGWIVITKTGFDKQMAEGVKKVIKKDEITIEDVAEQEMKMLNQAGYQVSMKIGDTEDE